MLKVGPDRVDFVDEIFHAYDPELSEALFNDRVVGDGNALLVDLCKPSFVDNFTHVLEVWVSPGNVGRDPLQHLEGGFVETNKCSAVDLGKTEQLQDFARLWCNLVDTME